MYNNGSSKDPSTSCQDQTALASTVCQTKSFCELELKKMSDYMVSVLNAGIIDEEAEKFKPLFKDRMQDYIRYSVQNYYNYYFVN
jgi:hypothetical protein